MLFGNMILSHLLLMKQSKKKKGNVKRLPFSSHYSHCIAADNHKKHILGAMQRFHEKTCIRFVPRTIERDYVLFTQSLGCVGNVRFFFISLLFSPATLAPSLS